MPTASPAPTSSRVRAIRLGVLFAAGQLTALMVVVMTTRLLPERIASHFDAAGHANGWMPHRTYLATMLVTLVVVPWLAMAAALAVALRGWLPPALRTLPPARQGRVRSRLVQLLALIAVVHVVVMTGVHLLVVQANRGHQPLSRAIWVVPFVMLLVVVVGIVRLHRSIMASR